MKTVLVAVLGLVLGAGLASAYFITAERSCVTPGFSSDDRFPDPRAALASIVAPEPDEYVVTLDYRDVRDELHHIRYGYYVEGELVEEVDVYEAAPDAWSVFSFRSCEGPSMP